MNEAMVVTISRGGVQLAGSALIAIQHQKAQREHLKGKGAWRGVALRSIVVIMDGK